MSQQLVKKGANGKHENVMPKSWIEAIKDKNTGQTLVEILQGFNMYFLPYNGNTSSTRCLVPTILRKKGLWITYVKYDGNVYTEWYAADEIDDTSWGDSSNWRIGNNTLVGDITISANGNWVINGTETKFKAIGEKGNTPLLRVVNNRLQVSYDLGDTYMNVTENPVYTQFRNHNNKIQVSTDLGATWTDASDEIAAYFRWQATAGDTQANNVGRVQISRDNKTWTNLSNDIVNNLHISRYIGVSESLPTSGIAEGTIYAKGPYYDEGDTSNSNPIYRLWVYAWKDNILAWQDNGEFTSIAAGVVQETGNSETEVMSQKAVSTKLSELGSYVENPEFVRVIIDNEGKILYGVKSNGEFYFGAGVPQQVIDYVTEKIKELSLEDVNGILSFLGTLYTSDETLKQLLDKKVDGEYVENPEYIEIKTDAEDKILEGITAKGFKQINIPIYTPSSTVEHIENPDYIRAITDNENKVLEGFNKNGEKVINVNTVYPNGIPKDIASAINKLRPHSDDVIYKSEDFVQGNLVNGIRTDSEYAICSKEFIPIADYLVDTGYSLKRKKTIKLMFAFYSSTTDSSWLEDSSWWNSMNTYPDIPNGANYFKVLIFHQDATWFDTFITPKYLDDNPIIYTKRIERIPDYWYSTLYAKERVIIDRDLQCGQNGDSFISIADTHIEANNLVSPLLCQHIIENTGVKKVLCMGDVMNGGKNKNLGVVRSQTWMNQFPSVPYYHTLGNHDHNGAYGATDDEVFTDAEMYSLFIKPLENKINTEKRLYYFFDNPTQKIRYFSLDGHWPNSVDNRGIDFNYDGQLDWMVQKAKEVGAEWSIVIFQHIVFTSIVEYQENPWKVLKADRCQIADKLVAKLDSVYDDADMPTIIGVFCGHTHYDYSEYSEKGYPLIATNSDSNWGYKISSSTGKPTDDDYHYTYGNTDEQCLDVVHIDKTNRKIYMTRIGHGENRDFNY